VGFSFAMIGQTVSHYRIIEKLGEGGMGVVYLAEDTHLGRRVAVKFLTSTDRHYRARFIREARAVSGLNHPNIATVHDYGETDEGQPFIVMEFVNGQSLSDLLEAGITVHRSIEIVASIAEALSEAHQQGIVHRDIKPSNIVVNERGQVKVLDFGLVKNLFERSSSGGVDLDAQTLYTTHTRSDVIVGTPLYLSPEQATGKDVDGRSDLFALGALLYECLTGQSAFSGSSVLEIGAQIIHVNPPPPSQINRNISKELDRITMKALEKKIEARYQTADELLSDLTAAATSISKGGLPVVSRRNSQIPAGGKRTTNTLATLTTSLRRERFSLTSLIGVVLVTGLVIWAVYYFWPRTYYQPSASALSWYERGTDALRNGAYYQASKALEQAVSIDNKYALAHARLAQAWTELDYIDRAKDELLAVDRSSLSPRDALYLDAITASVRREFSNAVQSYSEIARLSPDDAQVYVDLGYAYENNENPDKALENYEKAISMNNGQYATAFLRAGIVHNRKQNTQKAAEMFDKAEYLYSAGSNSEGVNEVVHQRGILFRNSGKYEDARVQFQRVLDSSRALGIEAQQVTALIDLSYLASTRGDSAEAEKYAKDAVSFAQQNQLENFVAGGLLELGNSFHSRGDYPKAEEYFKQAIQFARANKGKLRVARGLSNLGGLYIQTLRVDEGLALVQEALTFFQQGNYPRSVSFCLTQMGRGYRRKGDYGAALQALNQKLELAKASGSDPQVADCYGEIGAVLIDQENYPAALQNFNDALKIYQKVNNELRIVYNHVNRANILWRLGRYAEAEASLAEVVKINSDAKTKYKQLIPVVPLHQAEVFLSQRRFAEARSKGDEAITLAGNDFPDSAIEGKFVVGTAQALAGSRDVAVSLCDEAVKMATRFGDVNLIARARLAQAEVALRTKNAATALSVAQQVQEQFARGGQLESEWRAWLIAALASEQLGDNTKAAEQRTQARNTRAKLEQLWGSEAFKQYATRPDIQAYSKELG
jgi:serine/threonine protein kinase/lipopolysaccharide biosynthesis regulator YciM